MGEYRGKSKHLTGKDQRNINQASHLVNIRLILQMLLIVVLSVVGTNLLL